MTPVVVLLLASACAQLAVACYWNADCPPRLYSAKTPYDAVRGDIRDYATPQNCEAVTIWGLSRHGNRNPGTNVIKGIKYIVSLKHEIIASYDAGKSQLCAQDIQNLQRWSWNSSLDVSQSFLTGTGYKELYDIGSRLREKYPHLLQGSEADYYFRPTKETWVINSAIAVIDGLTEGTNLTLTRDSHRRRDDVIMPYEFCDRHQETVRTSQLLADQMEAYYNSTEYLAVISAVQKRLGISTQLSASNLYSLYEICRFDRSWSAVHQSPWCAAFSQQDLEVLEYRDDIRHYYRNACGSWVNVNLGGPVVKDLYENFEASISGQGKKVVFYVSHCTMVEMMYCAMGVFKDAELQATYRNPHRLWRTSINSPFSANVIAVLNRCEESGSQTHRVQIFINEKKTELCPLEGCTWKQFQDNFEVFKSRDLEFCNMK